MERTGHIQNQALILVCIIVGINAHDAFGLLVTRDPYRQDLSVTDANLFNSAVMTDNRYDNRHRRQSKTVRQLNGRGSGYPLDPSQAGTWDEIETREFIYDGWNMVRETVSHSNVVTDVIEYFWGMDLSGTLQGAGGVGGLLAVSMNGSFYFPCYDANGNVTDYVDAYGNVRGHFEYDAFGNTVAMWGDLAHTFRFRFSTKYYDVETQSYYYVYRHYAPKLGCWLSKDPIGERGGFNLYGFIDNNPLNNFDNFGLYKVSKCNIEILIGHNTISDTQKFGWIPKAIETHNCSAVSIHTCYSENININNQPNPDGISDWVRPIDAIQSALAVFENTDYLINTICSATDAKGKPCCCKKVTVSIRCKFGLDLLTRYSMPVDFCGKTKTLECKRK